MKQIIIHIISIISAIYFVFAGVGYNVINYCCDCCEVKGIEYITENSCTEGHHYNHDDNCCTENHYDYTISDFQQHTKDCNLLRLKLQTPTIQSTLQLKKTPVLNIQLLCTIDLIQSSGSSIVFSYPDYSPPEKVFQSSGREIICLKSVLII
ncbi:MAG: hypothetical protein Q7U47_07375 [Paludibacter sp.]|nr:hypothetical protein [Paludibacter sp.]